MIKSLLRTLVVAGLMLLAGCQTNGSTHEQQIAAACASTSAAIRTLTLATQFGKLDAEQIEQVRTAISITTPICAAPTPPTLDSLKLAAFTQAIALLQAEALRLETQP